MPQKKLFDSFFMNKISSQLLIERNSGCQVHSSALPLATEVASLIKKVTLALRSHIRGFPAESGISPAAG